jgi:hypothetical protein
VGEFPGIHKLEKRFGNKPCNAYHLNGECPNGSSCQYLHSQIHFSRLALTQYRRALSRVTCRFGRHCDRHAIGGCLFFHEPYSHHDEICTERNDTAPPAGVDDTAPPAGVDDTAPPAGVDGTAPSIGDGNRSASHLMQPPPGTNPVEIQE